MRVQLQLSRAGVTEQTLGLPVLPDCSDGVSVRQLQLALQELWDQAQEADWFPKHAYSRDLRAALIRISRNANAFPPDGITTSSRQTIPKLKEMWQAEQGKEFRVDVENMEGTGNLHQLKKCYP